MITWEKIIPQSHSYCCQSKKKKQTKTPKTPTPQSQASNKTTAKKGKHDFYYRSALTVIVNEAI